MASTTSTFAFFFLSFFLLSSNIIAQNNSEPMKDNNQNKLMSEACKNTLFNDLCVNTYASSPATKNCTDMACMAKISASAAVTKASNTSVYIEELLKVSDSPTLKGVITGCSTNYAAISKDLNDAVAELDKKEFKKDKVIMSLSTAMSQAGFCEKTFAVRAVQKRVLSRDNMECMNLCNNAIAIAKLLPSN